MTACITTDITTNTTHSHNAQGIIALKTNHPDIKELKRNGVDHSLHGNKVWRSCWTLIDYMVHQRNLKHLNALDIGCGWGVTGIYLAKKKKCKVIGIDGDAEVKPFHQLMCKHNKVDVPFRRAYFKNITKKDLANINLIAGADICFWDSLVDELFNLFKRAREAGVGTILISDPGRPTFFALAERCEKRLSGEVELIERKIRSPFTAHSYILKIKN